MHPSIKPSSIHHSGVVHPGRLLPLTPLRHSRMLVRARLEAVECRCGRRRGEQRRGRMLSMGTSRSRAPRRFRGLCGVALFAGLTAWTVFVNPTVFAGDCPGPTSSNITTTTSTSSHTIFGCQPPVPPNCGLDPGGTTLTCVTVDFAFGPTCIGTGNRDVPNDQPCDAGCCAGTSFVCEVPPFGTPCCVPRGKENINTNTDTTTFICKSATAPALAPWALALCAALLAAYAVRRVNRSRRASS